MKKPSASPILVTTPFSEFIRNASSSEKERVYGHVLKLAAERQQALIKRASLLSK